MGKVIESLIEPDIQFIKSFISKTSGKYLSIHLFRNSNVVKGKDSGCQIKNGSADWSFFKGSAPGDKNTMRSMSTGS